MDNEYLQRLAAAIQEKVFQRPADADSDQENHDFPKLTAEQIRKLMETAK